MSYFELAASLKVDDIFYEECYGNVVQCKVTTSPVISEGGLGRVVEFTAVVTGGVREGESISYFLTEGYDHYAPKLYRNFEQGLVW